VSADGKTLLMTRITPATSGDVAVMPMAGGEATVLVSTPGYDGGAQFSPDGRWITYVSNMSGRMEVYLRPVDGPERHAVSTSGGMVALWSPDGKRIFFRSGLQFMAVDVATSPKLTLSAPKTLFEHAYSFGPNITIANYGLSRDGRSFLVVDGARGHLSLIFDWLAPTRPKP
jgi:Tol biopolymer transport system component